MRNKTFPQIREHHTLQVIIVFSRQFACFKENGIMKRTMDVFVQGINCFYENNEVYKERIESMVENIYSYFCNGSQGNVLFEF